MKGKYWCEDIKVNGVTLTFKLDTGAEVTIIRDLIYSRFFSETDLEKARKRLFGT